MSHETVKKKPVCGGEDWTGLEPSRAEPPSVSALMDGRPDIKPRPPHRHRRQVLVDKLDR